MYLDRLPEACLELFRSVVFSCVAANLYSGGVITVGVVLAVFMSTSDEMLPILISHTVNAGAIVRILITKNVHRSFDWVCGRYCKQIYSKKIFV